MKNRRMKVLLFAAGVAFAISGIALAEDAYIQASGSQTINTGYFVNSKTVLEIDFALTSGDTSKTVFGGIDGSGTSCCLWSNGNGSLEPRLGSWCGGMVRSSTTRYTAKFDLPNRKVELYEHGATSPVATKDDTTKILDNGKSDRPLMLFAMGKSTYGWTNTDYGSCRIYSFKATEDGVTVLDWRPCVKGGVAGFLNTVDAVFHTADPGTLSAGGDVDEIPDDGYVELVGNNGGNNGQKSGGHYIELKDSSNNPYKPGANTRIELDYAFSPTNRVWTWVALSSHKNSDSGPLFELRAEDDKLLASLGTNTYRQVDTGLPLACATNSVRRKIVLDAHNGEILLTTAGVTNFLKTGISGTYAINETLPNPIRVGSWANGSWHCAPMKIYGVKIYESNVLKYDYVPTVQEGRVGLLAGSRFVAPSFNNSTDIVHVGGSEPGGAIAVKGAVEQDAYAESFGNVALNTGYFPTDTTKVEIDYQIMPTNYATLAFAKAAGVFGTRDGSGTTLCLLVNGSGNVEPNLGGWGGGLESAVMWRRKVVYDVAAKSVKQYSLYDVFRNESTDSRIGQSTGTSNRPLGLFALSASTDGSTFNYYGRSRIYHLKIWEGDKLVRDYVPCVHGGVPAMYDKVTDTPLTDAKLVVSGRGRGGAEEWVVLPQGGTLTKSEGSKVLSAVAVGAQSYKWTKNGAAVAGGTDGNLTVTWAKGGKTDIYTVIPVYSIFGEDCHGSPVSVAVYNAPLGMVIILK